MTGVSASLFWLATVWRKHCQSSASYTRLPKSVLSAKVSLLPSIQYWQPKLAAGLATPLIKGKCSCLYSVGKVMVSLISTKREQASENGWVRLSGVTSKKRWLMARL